MNPTREESARLPDNPLSREADEKDLIEKYKTSILEYLVIMYSSETVKAMEDAKYAAQFGISTITHIFRLAYYAYKNTAFALEHAQKGAYCYIEYIEQLQKINGLNVHPSGSNQSIDYLDAVSFIYDKTLSDLHPIQPVLGESVSVTVASTKRILDKFSMISGSLVWFDHPQFTLLDQIEIVDAYLMNYLWLFGECAADSSLSLAQDCCLFLDAIKQNLSGITKQEYMEILSILHKKGKKLGGLESAHMACLYLKTFSPGTTLSDIALQEKWKRPVEDLVKLAFK